MNRRALLALVLVALLMVPTAAAVTRGEPDVSLSLSDGRVAPGETATLQVSVSNTAEIDISDGVGVERVTTARGLTLEMDAGNAPLEVRTGKTLVGSVADGQVTTVPFQVAVDDDAEPGTYRVPVEITYTHASSASSTTTSTGKTLVDYNDEEVTETVRVTVRVTEEADFEVVNVSTEADVGGSGDLELTIENTGAGEATDASLTLQSTDADLTFGGQPTAESYVGEWASGERKTFTFSSEVAPDIDQRSLGITATVSYEDREGVETRTRLAAGVVPQPEQSFTLDSTDATLRVGEEGTLSGTVVNDGPNDAENAVLVLSSTSSSIDPVETEYALGDIATGDAAEFSFDVDVSSSARDGPRQFTYRVQYEGSDGTIEESDALYARHEVGPQREIFDVRSNATVEAGGSTALEVTVTNNGDEELTDISAKLFADSPISVSDDEAFVDSVAPGETATVRFQISAAGSATAKVYPVSLDFQYDEPDGDTKLSDTYQVPVTVTEPEGGGGIFGFLGSTNAIGLGLVLTVGGLAGVVLVARSRSR